MKFNQSRVGKNFPFLEYIRGLTKRERDNILKNSSKELQLTLCELALNTLNGNVNLDKKQINKLRPFKKQIYNLANKKTSIKKRKNIIQSGGFVTSFLATLIPALIASIVTASKKE